MKSKQVLLMLLLSLSFFKSNAQQQRYENLVFEGAGLRGIAYSGVIEALEQANIINNISKVAGTSAGAITALLVSLKYSSVEIEKIVSNTKFQKFNDGHYIFIGGLHRLNRNFGWYRAKAFEAWLGQIIKDKTGNADITFTELKKAGFKDLFVTGTCLNQQKLLVFSASSYPDMKVKDAVRISMSIPIYFEAVFIDSRGKVFSNRKTGKDLDVVVDGGIIGNFPIFIFDSILVDEHDHSRRIANPQTLGIRIDSDQQIENDKKTKALVPQNIKNVGDYLGAFYTIMLENLNRNTLIQEDWDRTVSVSSLGIGPKIKKLNEAQKQALIQSGVQHTTDFLQTKKRL